ncbi:hypothetical protein O181_129896 [Austropuccinia psidii MF-1]|uniref:Uncharacterized protein n=1 Tax=Austropuccinia psidii MF-1 TaxID=1389203 RepID=A0A9Q3Q8Z6_9BASI|nr:hypothetical protein [Austropuccinia psidii MF-1]
MGDSIREESDDEQDPKGEFLVEYQEETQLEIQDIQLEAGMPQDTANKNLCNFKEIERRKTSDFLHGHQKVVPQTVKTLNQKEQKLPYWGYITQSYTMGS